MTGTPSIERAWQGYREMLLHDASPEKIEECRVAYWAGAAVLFYAIMGHGLDEGDEPTADDLARMDSIEREVNGFALTFDVEALRRMRLAVQQ